MPHPTSTGERFEEAHDFIIKAWITPGPFRWEGKHYHYRYVDQWARPLRPSADLDSIYQASRR